MNKATILGRVGQDPETKQAGETTVTKFSVATSETWKDRDGNKKEKTEWHRCEAWGKQGEVIGKFFSKGKPILIEGTIQTDTYEKDGEKRYATKIKVGTFEFVPSSKGDSPSEYQQDIPPAIPPGTPNMAPQPDMNEEIPF